MALSIFLSDVAASGLLCFQNPDPLKLWLAVYLINESSAWSLCGRSRSRADTQTTHLFSTRAVVVVLSLSFKLLLLWHACQLLLDLELESVHAWCGNPRLHLI